MPRASNNRRANPPLPTRPRCHNDDWGLVAVPSQPENPLPPCPEVPNCVHTSEAFDAALDPLYHAAQQALDELGPIELRLQPEHREATAVYRVAMLFKDDVTVRVEPHPSSTKGVLHVRSASRVEQYDFGVNRCRVQRLLHLVGKHLHGNESHQR